MVREYTASFTSVKPCLYQPPPGTVIEVAPRPVGVKLHVPARSTEAIAAAPAAAGAGAGCVATAGCAAAAGCPAAAGCTVSMIARSVAPASAARAKRWD